MSVDTEPDRTAPAPPGRPRWPLVVVAVVAVVTVLAAVLSLAVRLGFLHPRNDRAVPTFASLTEHPDPSLHGTVAYFADDTGCVRLVAASGAWSKDLLCLSAAELAVRPEQGLKPAGPQLAWRADGRLEVTMFVWSPQAGAAPVFHPDWARIVDPRTGRVDIVPSADLPAGPATWPPPALVAPDGRRVSYRFDPADGRVTVTLTGPDGTRTLLSAQGPGEYTYSFGPVFWAPDHRWIAASDEGRILVIVPTTPAVTRVLVVHTGNGAGGGTAGPPYAVTDEDLLTAGG